MRDGSAPGTFCAALPDAGFCDDFDTTPALQPFWTKSSANGCDITVDANAKSAPRALHASCTSVAASNHIALSKVSVGRTLELRFALRIDAHVGSSTRLVSFTSEGRAFALTLTDGGLAAELSVGSPAKTQSFAFAKSAPSQTWFDVKIDVFYDARDGHVFIDVDDNRVVEQSGLLTYPSGQIPPANPILFGAESTVPGGTVDVSFDDIVIDPATLR